MTERRIWHGQLTTGRQLFWRGSAFLSGGLLWLAVFFLIPSLGLLVVAFTTRGSYGQVVWQFSFENVQRLLGFGVMEWSADYLRILLRSVWVATVTTVVCLLLAYPLAFFIAARPARTRYLWLALVVIPLCTNMVIRAYGWMLILAGRMPPARLGQWLGLLSPDAALYPGPLAVYLGMVSSLLPFTVLPLYTNVERIDWSLLEAAVDLYASRWRAFFHGVLMQTVPGLTVAVILTFIPAMGAFVVPDLLGGARTMLVGNLIQQQFGPSRDWPFGAAVSLGLMALTLAGLFLLRRSGKEVSV